MDQYKLIIGFQGCLTLTRPYLIKHNNKHIIITTPYCLTVCFILSGTLLELNLVRNLYFITEYIINFACKLSFIRAAWVCLAVHIVAWLHVVDGYL